MDTIKLKEKARNMEKRYEESLKGLMELIKDVPVNTIIKKYNRQARTDAMNEAARPISQISLFKRIIAENKKSIQNLQDVYKSMSFWQKIKFKIKIRLIVWRS